MHMHCPVGPNLLPGRWRVLGGRIVGLGECRDIIPCRSPRPQWRREKAVTPLARDVLSVPPKRTRKRCVPKAIAETHPKRTQRIGKRRKGTPECNFETQTQAFFETQLKRIRNALHRTPIRSHFGCHPTTATHQPRTTTQRPETRVPNTQTQRNANACSETQTRNATNACFEDTKVMSSMILACGRMCEKACFTSNLILPTCS